jgi:predicted RNase H-like HicB family nuclease
VPLRSKVVLHRTEEGISVSVPGLPGCWSEGDTEDEALENIRDAIREYLAARDDRARGAETREVELAVSFRPGAVGDEKPSAPLRSGSSAGRTLPSTAGCDHVVLFKVLRL